MEDTLSNMKNMKKKKKNFTVLRMIDENKSKYIPMLPK